MLNNFCTIWGSLNKHAQYKSCVAGTENMEH